MRRAARFASTIPVPNGRLLCSNTRLLLLEYSAEERAREEELRQKVQQQYRGMKIPPITNHEYGHFSTMGINETAAQQAAGDAGSQNYGGFGSQAFQGRGGVDWMMLLTGCALVYFSGKILFNQLTRGVNGLEMPLWTASVEMQAKHLLFAVQFDQQEQDQLKKDFEVVRQTNPFANFFEWLLTRRPDFCCGRKYSPDYALNALVSSLRSNDSAQLAGLARTLQQSISRRKGDSFQRVDDFVEQLQSAGFMFQSLRGAGPTSSFTPTHQPAPMFVPPVDHTQGGAEQSDLSAALESRSGEAHSSTPFGDTK